ncbi:toll/interleukin-1 receptor domain-containing protein [Streptomyces griseosporeus]|uniref:toll/interleukin-1 receptor domain-containing protein n=1 Tax=Streptomyces griseosporeus TaxID=1910 RepID=UPI00167ECD92|nr:toll/interleukin-1 receptor domain-containing protein [Streptomyces griseosporeus]
MSDDSVEVVVPKDSLGGPMKVFLSWSGSLSGAIAKSLNNWLTPMLQSVDFWISTHDISAGQRWFDRISRELDDTDFGVVCLTRKNVKAPWVNFESGALAKSIETARVVPVYVNLKAHDVGGPLSNFQGIPLTEDGIRSLVHDVNAVSERRVPQGPLDGLFDAMWPQLKADLDKARQDFKQEEEEEGPPRSAEEMFGEVLGRLRHVEARMEREAPRRHWKEEGIPSHLLLRLLREIEPPKSEEEWEERLKRLEWIARGRHYKPE